MMTAIRLPSTTRWHPSTASELTAADGLRQGPIVPAVHGLPFAGSEDIFVANEVQFGQTCVSSSCLWRIRPVHPRWWYPLRVNGSGCTPSSQRVGALVKIELLNLPVTAVGISPASQSVDNGASFTVDLAIDTDTASRGWQANVNFDATKMQCTSVTEGGFLQDYAIANGGGTYPEARPRLTILPVPSLSQATPSLGRAPMALPGPARSAPWPSRPTLPLMPSPMLPCPAWWSPT